MKFALPRCAAVWPVVALCAVLFAGCGLSAAWAGTEPAGGAGDDLHAFVKSSVSRVVVRQERVCLGTHCEVRPVYAHVVTRSIEAVPVRLASRQEILEITPAANSQVILNSSAVLTATCNCAQSGRCLCDPAQCQCASCATGRVNSLQASAINSTVHAAPACSVSQFASPRGPVTLEKDASGNALITHSGGVYGRKLARHLARGVRLGVD